MANFAIRYSPEIKRWYQRKWHRCGNLAAVAIKAVAAKLAKATALAGQAATLSLELASSTLRRGCEA